MNHKQNDSLGIDLCCFYNLSFSTPLSVIADFLIEVKSIEYSENLDHILGTISNILLPLT